jgi:hypothetical protein
MEKPDSWGFGRATRRRDGIFRSILLMADGELNAMKIKALINPSC